MTRVSAMEWLGVDWGTSNRRAYLVDGDGACLRRHEDERGMLSERGRFTWSLAAMRSAMGARPDAPVILSGMVGSAQGWQEVPCLSDAVPLHELPEHLAPVREMADCFIVPGYQRHGALADVMRGEETQLLGAHALGEGDGWFVLPGTHSKWVRIENGRLAHWSTLMTGELFALLAHSLEAAHEDADEAGGFAAGLALAEQRLPLTQALSSVRARVANKTMAASRARACIRGLLIGAEFAAIDAGRMRHQAIKIIASPELGPRYLQAAAYFGMSAVTLDPHDTYCAALRFIASRREAYAR